MNITLPKQLESKRRSQPRRPGIGDDIGLFFSQSLRSLSVTASLFPSSRFLATALLKPIDFTSARVIVELGVGTGAITGELLQRMAPDAVVLGIDLNPAFVNYVKRRITDARFIPVLGDAERLGTLLRRHGFSSADAIVSSLGLTAMPPAVRTSVLKQAAAHLTPEGVLTQYQYLCAGGVSSMGRSRFAEKEFLKAHFRHVASERVIWNLPPARVFTCRF